MEDKIIYLKAVDLNELLKLINMFIVFQIEGQNRVL